MNEKIYLTEEGKKKLEERLVFLTKQGRPEVVERLKTAREFGDLSENAEYDAAKDELAKVTSEIEQIEAQLKNAEIIKGTATPVISIGMKVRVRDLGNMGAVEEYTIVGTVEADISSGKISNESVVGSALMGKKPGDTVTVHAKNGDYKLEIVKIVS